MISRVPERLAIRRVEPLSRCRLRLPSWFLSSLTVISSAIRPMSSFYSFTTVFAALQSFSQMSAIAKNKRFMQRSQKFISFFSSPANSSSSSSLSSLYSSESSSFFLSSPSPAASSPSSFASSISSPRAASSSRFFASSSSFFFILFFWLLKALATLSDSYLTFLFLSMYSKTSSRNSYFYIMNISITKEVRYVCLMSRSGFPASKIAKIPSKIVSKYSSDTALYCQFCSFTSLSQSFMCSLAILTQRIVWLLSESSGPSTKLISLVSAVTT